MWSKNVERTKRIANVGGELGRERGRKIVLSAGLICIVVIALWLAIRIVRIMEGLRRIEITTGMAVG